MYLLRMVLPLMGLIVIPILIYLYYKYQKKEIICLMYHNVFTEKTEGIISENNEKLQKNQKSTNRYHANWLNMMYPRLKLARDLLTDDGVIFISIDDNEQANLKRLCDEIFGEENRVTNFCVIRAEGGGMAKQVVIGHEYCLTYSKNKTIFKPLAKPKDIRGKIIQKDGIDYWIQEDWLRKEFGKHGNCH